MPKEKVSFVEQMTPFKEVSGVLSGERTSVEFLTYKPEPKNCAITVNGDVYKEFTSFDKGIGEYEIITNFMKMISY